MMTVGRFWKASQISQHLQSTNCALHLRSSARYWCAKGTFAVSNRICASPSGGWLNVRRRSVTFRHWDFLNAADPEKILELAIAQEKACVSSLVNGTPWRRVARSGTVGSAMVSERYHPKEGECETLKKILITSGS